MNKLVYADLLRNSLLTHAQKACLHIKREGRYQSWTYADFHRDLNRLCSVLKKHGLKKGHNAIVIGENSPEWVIAFHGIFLTGACAVPVDPNIPPSEIESILSITEAKIVFCSPVYLNLFRTLKQKYGFPDKIVLLTNHSDEKEPLFEEFIASGNEEKDAFSERFEPDDPVAIIFTSGTTGKAKGAVLCQKNYTVVSRYAVPRMNVGPDDTMCAVLPLHHVFGFAACLAAALASGMDVVLVPFVKGPLILEALREKNVTILPAVPKMIALFYESILHNVKKKGPAISTAFKGMKTASAMVGDTLGQEFRRKLFSSVHSNFGGKLRLVISGGAALEKKYWNGFRLLGFNIVEGYGLTETLGPITLCPGNDPRLGSVGPILGENEIKIINASESGIGEVLLRGNCVFKGYYKNDELTAEVFDKDGWFHTGDLGKLDKDGYLYLSGRKKDMIVLDTGKNVYPDELEDYYGASPLIEELGIFGVKQNGTEIVAATIVPSLEIRKTHSIKQATEIIYNELIRMGKDLPVYRRISDFATVYSPLPRTTTRKLKKQELLKIYNSIKRKSNNRLVPEEQLSVLEVALMSTEEYNGVVESIKKVSEKIDTQIINPRSHLEIDLGLDSLKRIELLSEIEKRFSIHISEDVFDKMESIGDLVSMVKEGRYNPKEASVENIMSLKERILSESTGIIKLPRDESFLGQTSVVLSKIAGAVLSVDATGTDLFRKHSSPLIFASNHSHQLDACWILNALPDEFKKGTFFLPEKETSNLYQVPYSLHRRNMLKPGKNGDPIEMLKIYLMVLRSSRNLIVFPEGDIDKSGILRPFKSGIGLLARETGATIVPVRIKPKSGENKRPLVAFGKPIVFSELISAGICRPNCPAEDISEYIRSIVSGL